jgi:hypothetical protein
LLDASANITSAISSTGSKIFAGVGGRPEATAGFAVEADDRVV